MKTASNSRPKRRQFLSGIALLLIVMSTEYVGAQVLLDSAPQMQGVGITEHLGARIPTDLRFTDDHGKSVTLGDYFRDGKPVVLNLVYYDCPMLCNFVLNGVTAAARKLEWTPGKEYRLVTISINPQEGVDLAAAKKATYEHELDKPGSEDGWSFLVGDSTQSRALADALGWQYYYDPKIKEYVHTAATFVLTPEGTISRYLYGIEYEARDLKLALLEASEGKIGNTIDKLILYCFHYDPNAKGYVLFAQNVMKIGGVLSVALIAILLLILWRRERRTRHHPEPALRPR